MIKLLSICLWLVSLACLAFGLFKSMLIDDYNSFISWHVFMMLSVIIGTMAFVLWRGTKNK